MATPKAALVYSDQLPGCNGRVSVLPFLPAVLPVGAAGFFLAGLCVWRFHFFGSASFFYSLKHDGG